MYMYVCMYVHICICVCRHVKSFIFFVMGTKYKIYHLNHFICVHLCD